MKNLSLTKKISLLVLCGFMLISSLFFTACGGNQGKKNDYEKQGFTAVCSVTYQTNNSTINDYVRTLSSNYSLEFTGLTEITEDEYHNLECKYWSSKLSNNLLANKKIDYSVGDTIKFASEGTYPISYHKAKIKTIKHLYVYVKVLNDNQFELIDTSNHHYFINTAYFKIEYFI